MCTSPDEARGQPSGARGLAARVAAPRGTGPRRWCARIVHGWVSGFTVGVMTAMAACGPEQPTFQEVCHEVCVLWLDCPMERDEAALKRTCDGICSRAEVDLGPCAEKWKAAGACVVEDGMCQRNPDFRDDYSGSPCEGVVDQYVACSKGK